MLIESRKRGSVYLKFADDDLPEVARSGDGLTVTVRDLLTAGEELAIPADLVVLVTGMVPRRNDDLVRTLKLPVGRDGLFNEIHPKLRPVETVVDGVMIAGACQGPNSSGERRLRARCRHAGRSGAQARRRRARPPDRGRRRHRLHRLGACVEACPFGGHLCACGRRRWIGFD